MTHRGKRSKEVKTERLIDFREKHGYSPKNLQRLKPVINVSGVQIKPFSINALNTKQAFRAYKYQVGKCINCDWSDVLDVLEIHHKDKNKLNNAPSNLVVLCPTCHRLVHKGYLSLTQRNSREYII